MTPVFPRTNNSLLFTLEYFEIGRIAAQIKKIGGEVNLGYLDTYSELTLNFHKYMEDELNQTAVGSIQFVQLSHFEYVKSWLDSWQFNPGFEIHIERLIDEQNEIEQKRYEAEIERDRIEFIKSVPTGIGEGKLYVIDVPEMYIPFLNKTIPAKKVLKYNTFVTDKKPDLIDKRFLPEYITLLQTFINSFRNHSEKHVKRFFDGQLPVNGPLLMPPPSRDPVPSLPAPSTKLKVEISVPQLACLFRILKERKIIAEEITVTDLSRFIATNFSSKSVTEISSKSLYNAFVEPEKSAKDFWLEQIKKMRIDISEF